MSTRIEDFLIELSKDPYRTAQFRDSPEQELEGLGLTSHEMSVLAAGKTEELDRVLHMRKKPNQGKPKPKPKPKK